MTKKQQLLIGKSKRERSEKRPLAAVDAVEAGHDLLVHLVVAGDVGHGLGDLGGVLNDRLGVALGQVDEGLEGGLAGADGVGAVGVDFEVALVVGQRGGGERVEVRIVLPSRLDA